ncbi:Uma2 family endonuclease [Kineococcus rhizosphaerae]|uniref:Uma2 family endonuclease n=1 Tax=Kineococcus rhizosphaerae TaxID=559628 RepID=A0A2T0RAL2_9ACTN|nr:Uma2 family endonuclease [Kineococcus rhizosphaerae]PRY18206.1 Uma2 family endonuclease [Kineococcus rhizosphaerae]
MSNLTRVAAEVSEAPQAIRMSWEEFGALGEDVRGEHVDGMLVVSPRSTGRHQLAVANVRELLRGFDGVALTEWAWRPDGATREYQPDVMLLARLDTDARFTVDPPVLVVEVTSPSNAVEDRVRTLRDCARCGARNCWILDHGDRCPYAFTLVDGRYEPVHQGAGHVRLTGGDHTGVVVDVPALWVP